MTLDPRLISGNLGYRPWMARHLAHSFYAWPKTVFVSPKTALEPTWR